MTYHTYPREIWDKKKCEKLVKRIRRDSYGTADPFPGYLGSFNSIPPLYGGIKYNGGIVVKGKWYQGTKNLYPSLPAGFKIIKVPTWGWRIIKTRGESE